jgi:hypothetical protein
VRFLLIACEVLAREAYLCAARSPHIVDIRLLEKGLHDTPEDLRRKLQERIDEINGDYDAVLLGYGLCSNSTSGLMARGVRLVVPRAHDCITLYLGSRERYDVEFSGHPGTFYYTASYIERSDQSSSVALGAVSDVQRRQTYEEYVEKYGRDNADYLMDVMVAWARNYSRAAYIETGVSSSHEAERRAREEAERRGWVFEKLAGELTLIRKLVNGQWDEEFLVVSPGERTVAAYESSDVIASSSDGDD